MDIKSHARRRRQLTTRATRMAAAGAGFLHTEAAQIIAERLAVINRQFNKPALLFDGPFALSVADTIRQAGTTIKKDFICVPWPDGEKEAEILPMQADSADLIISVFDLQRVSDLQTMLLQINHALLPDGLFMAALPAHGFLVELHQALIEVESSLSACAAARIEHFLGPSELGHLMQQTGFKLVVADLEERTILYKALSGLLTDLRATGSTSLQTTENPTLPKAALGSLEAAYGNLAGEPDGRIRASARLVFASGWKHDASQQQPLRPGSAAHRMKDFLKSK